MRWPGGTGKDAAGTVSQDGARRLQGRGGPARPGLDAATSCPSSDGPRPASPSGPSRGPSAPASPSRSLLLPGGPCDGARQGLPAPGPHREQSTQERSLGVSPRRSGQQDPAGPPLGQSSASHGGTVEPKLLSAGAQPPPPCMLHLGLAPGLSVWRNLQRLEASSGASASHSHNGFTGDRKGAAALHCLSLPADVPRGAFQSRAEEGGSYHVPGTLESRLGFPWFAL